MTAAGCELKIQSQNKYRKAFFPKCFNDSANPLPPLIILIMKSRRISKISMTMFNMYANCTYKMVDWAAKLIVCIVNESINQYSYWAGTFTFGLDSVCKGNLQKLEAFCMELSNIFIDVVR